MLFISKIFHVDSNYYRFHIVFFLISVVLLIVSVNGQAETESMKFVAEYNLTDAADGTPSQGYTINDVLYLPDNEHLVLTGTSKNLWNIQDRIYHSLRGNPHSKRIAYNVESNRLAITYSYEDISFFFISNLNTEPPSNDYINDTGVTNLTYPGNVIFGENSSVIYLADSKKIYRWEFQRDEWSCNGIVDLFDGRDGIKALFFDEKRMSLIAVIRNGDCFLLDTELTIEARINFTGLQQPNRYFSSPNKPICYLNNHTVVWKRDDIIFFNLTTGTYSTVSLGSNRDSPLLVPSHNGKWLAIVNYGTVAIYDLETLSRITQFVATARISAICWSYDDTRIATADYNGVAQIWINIKDPGYNRRPLVIIESPLDGQTVNNTLVVSGIATDDNSITSVVYRIDNNDWTIAVGLSKWNFIWDTRFLTNGYHRIAVRAFDGEHYSHLSIVNVNIQNNESSMVPPNIMIDLPNEEDVVSGQVTFTGRVEGPNQIQYVWLLYDNERKTAHIAGNLWFISIDTRYLSESLKTFGAIAYDGILNSTPAQVNISIYNTPGEVNSPPWVTISSPLNNGSVSGMLNVQGTARDPEENLRFVMIRIDEGPWIIVSQSTDWEYTLNSWFLDNGQHRVFVMCADDIQMSSIASLVIYVSNDWEYPFGKPICMIQSPENGSRVNGTISIIGIANDDNTVSSVWISINDDVAQRVIGTDQWEFELDTRDLDNGRITIRCWAYDGSNDSLQVIWHLIVDNNIRPKCRVVWPINGSVVSGLIDIVGTADDEDNVLTVYYSIEDDAISETNGTEHWTFQFNTVELENGEITIEVWATDSIEESIRIEWKLVIKNNLPPTCKIMNPPDGHNIRSDVEINGSAFDPDGDEILVELRIDNGSWQSCIGGINWTYRLTLGLLSPGVHTVYSRSYDGQTYSSIDEVEITIIDGEHPNNESPDSSFNWLIFLFLILVVIFGSYVILLKLRPTR